MVTAGVPDQGGGLTAGVTIRVPKSLARAATAVAAGEGLYVSEWIRNLVAAEVARRDGRVTVSRADLDLVLACFDPRTEHAGNARDRLLAEMGPS